MSKTKAEIRDRAGNDLGILPLNGSLQSQDVTRIESAYDEIYAQLKKDGVAVWASTANVPNELVPYVVALVADDCLNTYGVSEARYIRIKSEALNAKREISKYTATDYESQDGATDY